ncbi:hypothetical protein YQE_08132, partial [Dendroctonus ponderosae]
MAFPKKSASIGTSQMDNENDSLLRNLIPAHRSAFTALGVAKELKTYFLSLKPADLEKIYNEIRFPRLPSYPLYNMSDEEIVEMKNVLDKTDPKTAFRSVLHDIEIVQIVYNVIADSFEKHPLKAPSVENNFDFIEKCKVMRGLLSNVRIDLSEFVAIKPEDEDEAPEIITNEMIDQMSETQKVDVDWMVLRALVEVLEYTAMLFEHYKVPTE